MTHPRYVTAFALEAALVFGVLYFLAEINALLMHDLSVGAKPTFVSLNGLGFVGCLLITRRAILGEADNLRRELVVLAAVSIAFGLVAMLAWVAYFRSPMEPPAMLVAEGIVAVPFTLAGWRWFSIRYQVLDGYRERILIVGSGESARQVARWMGEQVPHEYQLVGFADEDDSRFGQIIAMGARILTHFRELEQFSVGRVDRIIVALDEKRGKLPIRELMHVRLAGIEIEDATSFFERASGKLAVETMLPSWLVFSEGFKMSALRRMVKRLGDVAVSSILLVATAPLMLVTATLIFLESGRPIFYRQRRVGRNGAEFDILKFRSMVQNAETKSGPTWAGRNDPRVTRLGRIIRQFRIDELPQLINVLRGEMSFVGPRPERKHFVVQLEKEIEYYSLRTTVRPGLTGWAQVMYRYGATTEDAREKLKYDLFYIKNASALYDLWILLKTVKVVVTAAGAR
jgi:sugar transferase (PEP-CTERM system associated)